MIYRQWVLLYKARDYYLFFLYLFFLGLLYCFLSVTVMGWLLGF
jgi:hypothetical protein